MTFTRRALRAGLAAGALGLAAPPAAPALEKGLNVRGDQVSRTQQAGAGWVRLFVSWADSQPSPTTLNLSGTASIADVYARRGIRVAVVVTGTPGWANGGRGRTTPPDDPGTYAAFMADLARAMGPRVSAYEVWNEPDGDGDEWWTGTVEDYAALLKATYPAVKAVVPAAKVITAGLVGNHFAYVERLYALGAGPSFDAVAVHTDTACLDKGPDFYYREPDGRIGRYAFTGYREVHRVMAANGDAAKQVWLSELGWNTKAGACDQGAVRTDPDRRAGVSRADQATHLRRAYECLHQDPYIGVASWFELADRATGASENSANHFGLLEADGTPKPAFSVFSRLDASRGRECGGYLDAVPPVLTVRAPAQGLRFAGALAIDASATDDRRVLDLDVLVDGVRVPKGISQGQDRTRGALRFVYLRAAELAPGRHVVTFRALDETRNVTTREVVVEKVGAGAASGLAPVTLTARIGRLRGRKLAVSGQVAAAGGVQGTPTGKLQLQFERYDRDRRRFKLVSRFTGKASRGRLAKLYRFNRAGRWRVTVIYAPGKAPFRAARSRPRMLTVR